MRGQRAAYKQARRFLSGQAARRARKSRFRIFTFLLAHTHTHLLYTDGWVVAGDLSHNTTTAFHLRLSQRFPKIHWKRASGCSAPACRLKDCSVHGGTPTSAYRRRASLRRGTAASAD